MQWIAIRHSFCFPVLPARCPSICTRVLSRAGRHHLRRCGGILLLCWSSTRRSRSAISPLRTATQSCPCGSASGGCCIHSRRSRWRHPTLLWMWILRLRVVPSSCLRTWVTSICPLVFLRSVPMVIGPTFNPIFLLMILPNFSTLSMVVPALMTGCVLGNRGCVDKQAGAGSQARRRAEPTTRPATHLTRLLRLPELEAVLSPCLFFAAP